MTAQTYTALLRFDVACKYFPRLGAFALKVPLLESLKDHASYKCLGLICQKHYAVYGNKQII